jgi:hypothetical protein
MNLILDKRKLIQQESILEWHYFASIFREMSDDSFFNGINILFTDNLESLPENFNKEKSIIFVISDERYTLPLYADGNVLIFKNYVLPEQEKFKVYPIPMGYSYGIVPLPVKKISERKFDIGFQGNLHTSRPHILNHIIQELNNRNTDRAYNVLIANSTNSLKYSENLNDTKISLILDGQITPETFRFFESTYFGCVNLASKNLPNNWLYSNNDYYKVDWNNPKEIVDLISNLLNDSDLLLQSSLNSYNSWKQNYSPSSVKNYIKNLYHYDIHYSTI